MSEITFDGTRSHFVTWSCWMSLHLKSLSLFECTIESNPNFDDEKWQKRNSKALKEIQLYLGNDAYNKITSCVTAKEAWLMLHSIYGKELNCKENEREKDEFIALFHSLVMLGDEKRMRDFLDNYGDNYVTKLCVNTGLSSVHVAINLRKIELVRKLVHISSKSLLVKSKEGYTPLAFVAGKLVEESEMAALLVSYAANDEDLHNMLTQEVNCYESSDYGLIPVLIAALRGHKKMTNLLFSRMNPSIFASDDHNYGKKLVTFCIHNCIFDVVLELWKHQSAYQKFSWTLISYETAGCKKPLLELASKCHLFQSRAKLNILTLNKGCRELQKDRSSSIAIMKLFSTHIWDTPQEEKPTVREAVLVSAQNGIVEFVSMFQKLNPCLVLFVEDRNKRGVLSHAVLNRQKYMFEYLLGLDCKNEFMSQEDIFGNTILHLAGEMPHSAIGHRGWNAFLKMYQEFRWFESVEDIVPTFKTRKNKDGHTPSEVFSRSHKDLVEEAAKWTTDVFATTFIAFATIFMVASAVNATRLPPDPADYFVVASRLSSLLSLVSFLVFIALKVSLKSKEEFMRTVMKNISLGLFAMFLSVVLFVCTFFPYHGWSTMANIAGGFLLSAFIFMLYHILTCW